MKDSQVEVSWVRDSAADWFQMQLQFHKTVWGKMTDEISVSSHQDDADGAQAEGHVCLSVCLRETYVRANCRVARGSEALQV